MPDTLLVASVFLVAAVVMVPLSVKARLGSVLGYLIAGMLISYPLQKLEVDVSAIQQISEFGVVMMLFLIGLELEPKKLWELRSRLFGLGSLQVAATTLLITVAARIAFGMSWSVALACGLVLVLSSTAIVLQTLKEKGLMHSDGGQASFSVLLFQDVAVIPIIALLPLLATPELVQEAARVAAEAAAASADGTAATSHGAADDGHREPGELNMADDRPGWQATLLIAAAIGGVIAAGLFLTRPLFKFVALANMRELFVAAALMLVGCSALLMMLVGLSPALGTFIAGVVLANSEYRHELESNITPFRGLLLGAFFMTVGASVNFALLVADATTIAGLTAAVVVIKSLVLFALARLFSLRGLHQWLLALALGQSGEFGFVLLAFAAKGGVLPIAVADRLLLVISLSMLVTPLLFIVYERLIVPRYENKHNPESEQIDHTGQAIVAGNGRFGAVVNRMLLSAGYETTVLDYSPQRLETLRSYGIRAFFGDATRPDLLYAAGIEQARLLVVTIQDAKASTMMVRQVRAIRPDIHIIARAHDRYHVYELHAAGANDIVRDTFASAVRAGSMAWEAFGMHPFEADTMAHAFAEADLQVIAKAADLYDPSLPSHLNEPFREQMKVLFAEQASQLTGRSSAFSSRAARAWTPPTVRDCEADEQANLQQRSGQDSGTANTPGM